MAERDRVWLEVAFEGGQALRVTVPAAVADDLDGTLEVDVLVVAFGGFGGGREDRLGEAVRFGQSGRQVDPADLAGALVLVPPRATQVAADDALDRQHLESAALARAGVRTEREQVVRDEVARLPMQRPRTKTWVCSRSSFSRASLCT